MSPTRPTDDCCHARPKESCVWCAKARSGSDFVNYTSPWLSPIGSALALLDEADKAEYMDPLFRRDLVQKARDLLVQVVRGSN